MITDNNVNKLPEHPLNHCEDCEVDFSFQQHQYKNNHKIEMKFTYHELLPRIYWHGFIIR